MNVVISQTVALNGGDAAILFGLLDTLKRAFGNVNVTVFDNQPEIAGRLYPEIEFQQLLWHHARTRAGRAAIRKSADLLLAGKELVARALVGAETFEALQAYAQADLFIWTGGTYLVEHYDLEPRFFELDVLERFDAPLVLFTQSAGPFHKPVHRSEVARLGERASRIFCRDERTFDNFVDVGVSATRLEVVADGAFALAPLVGGDRSGQVIVSVRHWPHGDDAEQVMEHYIDSHAQAVARLVTEHDARVMFLSTCQGVPEYWSNDSDTAMKIVERLGDDIKPSVHVDDRFHSPAALLEIYGAADMLIATRMHAAILGLMAGTAVLPVAYEFKTRELFKHFDQVGWVTELNDIRPHPFGQRVVDAYVAREQLEATQRASVPDLRRSAASVADELRTLMELS